MRDIEFRAWDNELGCFQSEIHTWVNNNPRFVLDQSTGIIDCRGKKVFENDIVKCTCPTGDVIKGVIQWQSVGILGWVTYVKERLLPYNLHTSNRYEVLGNIYENPDLLKE